MAAALLACSNSSIRSLSQSAQLSMSKKTPASEAGPTDAAGAEAQHQQLTPIHSWNSQEVLLRQEGPGRAERPRPATPTEPPSQTGQPGKRGQTHLAGDLGMVGPNPPLLMNSSTSRAKSTLLPDFVVCPRAIRRVKRVVPGDRHARSQ